VAETAPSSDRPAERKRAQSRSPDDNGLGFDLLVVGVSDPRDASDATGGGGRPAVPDDGHPASSDEHGDRQDDPGESEDSDDRDDDRDDDHSGVFGEAVPAAPVEPGTPSIENAAFVLLGVASTVGLIVHLVSLAG